MYVVTNNGTQTIWDLAYKYYGSYNAVAQLILDNPDVLDFDNPVNPGVLIKITEYVAPVTSTQEIPAQSVESVSRYEIAKINQSLWDLALEYYGSYDGVERLLQDNAGVLDLYNDIEPGTKILITQKPLQDKMVDYLSSKGYQPSTAIRSAPEWILETHFWNDAGVWDDINFWKD